MFGVKFPCLDGAENALSKRKKRQENKALTKQEFFLNGFGLVPPRNVEGGIFFVYS